jgi:membrane peptidoglycan carboxypeptidase
MLAGLLKGPNSLSPWANLEGPFIARKRILRRMHAMAPEKSG